MRKLILVAAVLVAASSVATAGGRVRQFFHNVGERLAERRGGGCESVSAQAPTTASYGPSVQASATSSVAITSDGQLQAKADAQARAGRCFHPGGGFVPGANFEGVGYSSASAHHALAACCNNGGQVLAEAVAQGPNGWFAVRQYAAPGPLRTFVGGTLNGVGDVFQHTGNLLLPRAGCANGVCR